MCSWGYCNVPLDYILIGESVGIIYFFVVIVPFAGYVRDIRKKLEKQKQKKAPVTYDWWVDLCIGKLTYCAVFGVLIMIYVIVFDIELAGEDRMIVEFFVSLTVILVIGMLVWARWALKNHKN